ncbi:hypothetical protein SELMODRAFT_430125 [Selaginella moellendorffii]|uniref:Uncharacterized protein n=1 Tax=Selaginella moellendorffii TaxID=88036 RepID=D8T8F2_SELML|nr:hypothetical protein SELMODRAFT_430125 [Selaginella moellendorffii]
MNTESPMWDRGLLERATRHHKRPTTRKVEPGLAGNVVKRKFTPQHLPRQHSRKCSEELQKSHASSMLFGAPLASTAAAASPQQAADMLENPGKGSQGNLVTHSKKENLTEGPQVERSTSSEGSNSTDDKRDNNFISELM